MARKQQVRKGEDRRQDDVGPPPGWKDRRVSVERRMIQVAELPFAEFELHRQIRLARQGLGGSLS